MVTIIELIGLLSKTSPALNNKKVLVDVVVPHYGVDGKFDFKFMCGCEVADASFNEDDNIILVCRGNK